MPVLRIPSVLLVHKRSFWSVVDRRRRIHTLPAAESREWRRNHAEHEATLRVVQQTLRGAGVRVIQRHRAHLSRMPPVDLVITLGGDGTLLRTAHRAKQTPLLGVNSDPQASVGFFCCATRRTFRAHLHAALRGALPIRRLTRLQVRINDRAIREPVLNDCLVTHRNPAATSRYVIQCGRRQYMSASSGVWIATPAGSTAGIRASGGYVLPLTARQYQFAVREPIVRGNRPNRIRRGRLAARSRMTVTSLMEDGMLYIDGPHVAYRLGWGDRASFGLSPYPALVLGISR